MHPRLLPTLLAAFCSTGMLVACSPQEQAEPTAPEPAPVDLAALTADWEMMTPETLGAPEITAEVDSPYMVNLITTLPPELIAKAHLDPVMLAGSAPSLDLDSDEDWQMPEGFYDPEGGVDSLFRTTRFGDGWAVDDVRGRGAWETTSQDVSQIHVEWVGSLAYDLSRGEETRTVVIGRELSFELGFRTDRMVMERTISTTDMDWCASDEASAFIPGDVPTEVPGAVADPADPYSGRTGNISEILDECENGPPT